MSLSNELSGNGHNTHDDVLPSDVVELERLLCVVLLDRCTGWELGACRVVVSRKPMLGGHTERARIENLPGWTCEADSRVVAAACAALVTDERMEDMMVVVWEGWVRESLTLGSRRLLMEAAA